MATTKKKATRRTTTLRKTTKSKSSKRKKNSKGFRSEIEKGMILRIVLIVLGVILGIAYLYWHINKDFV